MSTQKVCIGNSVPGPQCHRDPSKEDAQESLSNGDFRESLSPTQGIEVDDQQSQDKKNDGQEHAGEGIFRSLPVAI